MPTSNDLIFESFIRRQIYLTKYANGLVKDSVKLLSNSEDELSKNLLFYADKLSNTKPATAAYKRTKDQLVKELTKIRKPVYSTLRNTILDEMIELAVMEADFAAKTINASVPTDKPNDFVKPTRTELKASLSAVLLPEGKNLPEMLDAIETADISRMTGQLTNALNTGSTPAQATKIVKDGAIKRSKEVAATIVRTATNSTSAQAKNDLYDKNKKFVEKEIYRATLDSKTTPRCSSLDGKIYNIGDGIFPPQHWNCRSVRVPYIDRDNSFWNRAFDPSTEKTLLKDYAKQNKLTGIRTRADLPHGTKQSFDKFARKRRRELIGRAPDKVNYSEFLRKQSNDFQEEILGIERAKIFRESGKDIGAFVNPKGDFYTLAELKNKKL